MQQAEDVAGYLSLWSATAKRPTAEQLKYVFEAGDDTYSDIAIVGAFPAGDRVRVRVSATRDRVSPARIPGRPPFTSHTTTAWSLTYVREGDDWKLVRKDPRSTISPTASSKRRHQRTARRSCWRSPSW